MLLFGYLGEINLIPVLLGVSLGFIPFLMYYYIIYKKYALLSDEGIKIFSYFFVVWSFYGVVAYFPYKIKNICNSIYNKETNTVSEGIILIYSSYIDAGIIPMSLALEEMGFIPYGEKSKPLFKNPPTPSIDVRTMKPPASKKDFKPARYIMITGDHRISPNNDSAVKAITNNNNIFTPSCYIFI